MKSLLFHIKRMKSMHPAAGRKGFTLIEMILVFTLIGILVGLGLPQYKYATIRAREAVLKENLFQIRKLLSQYYVDKAKYPPTLRALVEEGYLRSIPDDPITKSSDTWIEIPESLAQDEVISGTIPGIMDVVSGSEKNALDGSPYNTW